MPCVRERYRAIAGLPSELLLLIFFLIPNDSTAALSGPMRTSFISGVSASCFETQRGASFNATVPSVMLRQYCNCTGVYLADMLNNELLISIHKGENRLNPNLQEMAANYCRANFHKYQAIPDKR